MEITMSRFSNAPILFIYLFLLWLPLLNYAKYFQQSMFNDEKKTIKNSFSHHMYGRCMFFVTDMIGDWCGIFIIIMV